MTEPWNQKLYEASIKALQENGVPVNAAERASRVVASDAVPPDRTEAQQREVDDAMTWFWASKTETNKNAD